VLLSPYYLAPALLYGDLVMKKAVLPAMRTWTSSELTPFFAVLSLTDVPWLCQAQFSSTAWKFQAGMPGFAAHAAFAWRCAKGGGSWALAFAVTSWIILLVIGWPGVFSRPPLKYADIAQFPFRFLSLFTLAGSVSGALALRRLFKERLRLPMAARNTFALAMICLSLALSGPYLYPRSAGQPGGSALGESDIMLSPGLEATEDAYHRPAPEEGAFSWTDPARSAVKGTGTPANAAFRADLSEYYRSSGGPRGEVFLDIIHYPGLQDIETMLQDHGGRLHGEGRLF
jgi:hypothetical protein